MMEQAAVDYLAHMGVTLWPGVAFDITDDKERARAAAWLVDTIRHICDDNQR